MAFPLTLLWVEKRESETIIEIARERERESSYGCRFVESIVSAYGELGFVWLPIDSPGVGRVVGIDPIDVTSASPAIVRIKHNEASDDSGCWTDGYAQRCGRFIVVVKLREEVEKDRLGIRDRD